MRVLDPGHVYSLDTLDGDIRDTVWTKKFAGLMVFVKREGARYPGNVGHHPGTTIQEVLRALIDRMKYLDQQIPCSQNLRVTLKLREALLLLEERAAIRHGREPIRSSWEIELRPTCPKCLHIGCKGTCHP